MTHRLHRPGALLLLLLAGCEAAPSDHLVVRPVSDRAVGAAAVSEVAPWGETLFFDPAAVLLDMHHVVASSATLELLPLPEGDDLFAVSLALTSQGQRILREWTEANIGKRLGFFVAGRLRDAPRVNSPLSGEFLLVSGFSRSEAEVLRDAIADQGAQGERRPDGAAVAAPGNVVGAAPTCKSVRGDGSHVVALAGAATDLEAAADGDTATAAKLELSSTAPTALIRATASQGVLYSSGQTPTVLATLHNQAGAVILLSTYRSGEIQETSGTALEVAVLEQDGGAQVRMSFSATMPFDAVEVMVTDEHATAASKYWIYEICHEGKR